MPIKNIIQPEYINISSEIRLLKYDGKIDFALDWYQDEETLMLVEGRDEPYDIKRLSRMYNYLNQQGELYFIEYKICDKYVEIGDVTFSAEDMPIVIGNKSYRGYGIGKKVVLKLIERGKELGYKKLFVNEIYNYNIGSQKLFESVGFKKYEKTIKGYRYSLDLTNE
ncbi:MAG: GNAT family N-acetyltransferase [Paraclostridium sp.]